MKYFPIIVGSNATCHMFNLATNRHEMSCPCASVSLARDVATAQLLTTNIVESRELTAGYRHGKLLFCTSDQKEIQHWMTMLKIKMPKDETEPPPDWREKEAEIRAENERLARKHQQWLARNKKMKEKVE